MVTTFENFDELFLELLLTVDYSQLIFVCVMYKYDCTICLDSITCLFVPSDHRKHDDLWVIIGDFGGLFLDYMFIPIAI